MTQAKATDRLREVGLDFGIGTASSEQNLVYELSPSVGRDYDGTDYLYTWFYQGIAKRNRREMHRGIGVGDRRGIVA